MSKMPPLIVCLAPVFVLSFILYVLIRRRLGNSSTSLSRDIVKASLKGIGVWLITWAAGILFLIGSMWYLYTWIGSKNIEPAIFLQADTLEKKEARVNLEKGSYYVNASLIDIKQFSQESDQPKVFYSAVSYDGRLLFNGYVSFNFFYGEWNPADYKEIDGHISDCFKIPDRETNAIFSVQVVKTSQHSMKAKVYITKESCY